jgi:hypothetical protein
VRVLYFVVLGVKDNCDVIIHTVHHGVQIMKSGQYNIEWSWKSVFDKFIFKY